jgi:hypothetical protein
VALFASIFTQPLEVAGIVLTASGFGAGFSAVWELLGGGNAKKISDAATVGAAIGFLVGLYLGVIATVYLVVNG